MICTLTGASGFTPLKGVRKELRISPYGSVKEKIKSRHRVRWRWSPFADTQNSDILTAGLPYRKPLVLRHNATTRELWAAGVCLFKCRR